MGDYHDDTVAQMGKKDGSQMTSTMMMTNPNKAKATTQAETLENSGQPISSQQKGTF